jgi:hypothetical protein
MGISASESIFSSCYQSFLYVLWAMEIGKGKHHKVAYLHSDLRPVFKRAMGRNPSPDEMRALVTIQQSGGAEVDMALFSFLAETHRHNMEIIEEGLSKRHLSLIAGVNRRLAAVHFDISRQLLVWIGLGALALAVYIFLCIYFMIQPGTSVFDDCFGGQGRMETNSAGERHCVPIDKLGNIIKWRLP